jgi:hypothetical protein
VEVFSVGDALVDGLVQGGRCCRAPCTRSGRRAGVHQHAVQEFAAPRADEALAGRVHARSLDGRLQDGGADGLEDGSEGRGEVRAAVADQEPEVLEPPVQIQGL